MESLDLILSDHERSVKVLQILKAWTPHRGAVKPYVWYTVSNIDYNELHVDQ